MTTETIGEAVDVWAYGVAKPVDEALGDVITIRPTGTSASDVGMITNYDIMLGEKKVGRIHNFTREAGGLPWLAVINGCSGCDALSFGNTPEEAVRLALTKGIQDMAEALEKVKAAAVYLGDDMIAAAEGLPA